MEKLELMEKIAQVVGRELKGWEVAEIEKLLDTYVSDMLLEVYSGA